MKKITLLLSLLTFCLFGCEKETINSLTAIEIKTNIHVPNQDTNENVINHQITIKRNGEVINEFNLKSSDKEKVKVSYDGSTNDEIIITSIVNDNLTEEFYTQYSEYYINGKIVDIDKQPHQSNTEKLIQTTTINL